MNKIRKNILRGLRCILTVLLSKDYIYVSSRDNFQGKCPTCGFDHSQENITRYGSMKGCCKFMGIHDTEIDCFKSPCSNPDCGQEIRWYENIKEGVPFLTIAHGNCCQLETKISVRIL